MLQMTKMKHNYLKYIVTWHDLKTSDTYYWKILYMYVVSKISLYQCTIRIL